MLPAPAASAAPVVTRPPVFDLQRYAGSPALLTSAGDLTYGDLDRSAAEVAAPWGSGRRLVLIAVRNELASVVSYLAALNHGHVPLLVPGDRPVAAEELRRRYRPDVVCAGEQRVLAETEPVHDLHRDLALLLSTSGSTGSPRLVRLSRENLRSNATAIASYLELGAHDRGITSLPLHYCYGLSVLHSHLAVGAAVVLTDLSVVDDCFWELARRTRTTSLAAVPYTVDLLERSGFADRPLPSLRRLTQAGGRLAPDRVRHLAALGAERGWDLHVMYGQTEATARIAHLPPHLASQRPEAVGVAIPGGSLTLEPVAGEPDDVGELVYHGPNVMLGYAESPADLASGREVTALRTGDLARLRDGLVEIVGRSSRRAKLFGLRLDLDRLEELLVREGRAAALVADEDRLHAFVAEASATEPTRQLLATLAGVPVSAVQVHQLAAVPRTASGKTDHVALLELAALAHLDPATGHPTAAVRDHVALVLGRPDAGPEDTFAGLGGDSLSYVEAATRLAPLFPEGLPVGWHTTPLEVLQRRAEQPSPGTLAGRRRRVLPSGWMRIDTTIVLRTVAVLLILCSHADLVDLQGGAHVLLAVAGFNFARFQLAATGRADRWRHGIGGLLQLALPSMLWIGAVGLLLGGYRPATALFLNGLLGSDRWDDQWQFWFLEALTWTIAATVALLAVPVVHRLERWAPFGFALAALAVTATLRFVLVGGVEAGPTERYSAPVVACFFVLGWAAARARTAPARLLVGCAAVLLVAGFFGEPRREVIVVTGVLLLWVPTVPLPRAVVRPISAVAAASLCIYLTQWQVYPPLEDAGLPVLAVAASLAVGIAYAAATRPLQRTLSRALWRARRRGRSEAASRAASRASYQHPRPARRSAATAP
ncbi:MAG: AMP-binding protein [Marmoricola sp.]